MDTLRLRVYGGPFLADVKPVSGENCWQKPLLPRENYVMRLLHQGPVNLVLDNDK